MCMKTAENFIAQSEFRSRMTGGIGSRCQQQMFSQTRIYQY